MKMRVSFSVGRDDTIAVFPTILFHPLDRGDSRARSCWASIAWWYWGVSVYFYVFDSGIHSLAR